VNQSQINLKLKGLIRNNSKKSYSPIRISMKKAILPTINGGSYIRIFLASKKIQYQLLMLGDC